MIFPFIVAVVCTVAALYMLWEYVEVPQKLLLESWGLPDAASVVLSVVLVPAEAALLNVVLFQLLFSKVPDAIMKAVLAERNVGKKLLQQYGVQEIVSAGILSNTVDAIFFLVLQAAVMISAAPLHAVAGLGQVCWVASCGWVRTWDLLADTLPLIGFRSTWAQSWHVVQHIPSYVGFGTVAFTLELVPFANILFIGGNAYGAALLFESFVDRGEQGPDPLPVPSNNVKGGISSRALPLTSAGPRPKSMQAGRAGYGNSRSTSTVGTTRPQPQKGCLCF